MNGKNYIMQCEDCKIEAIETPHEGTLVCPTCGLVLVAAMPCDEPEHRIWRTETNHDAQLQRDRLRYDFPSAKHATHFIHPSIQNIISSEDICASLQEPTTKLYLNHFIHLMDDKEYLKNLFTKTNMIILIYKKYLNQSNLTPALVFSAAFLLTLELNATLFNFDTFRHLLSHILKENRMNRVFRHRCLILKCLKEKVPGLLEFLSAPDTVFVEELFNKLVTILATSKQIGGDQMIREIIFKDKHLFKKLVLEQYNNLRIVKTLRPPRYRNTLAILAFCNVTENILSHQYSTETERELLENYKNITRKSIIRNLYCYTNINESAIMYWVRRCLP